ncbi:MAG: hypothetical protein QM777_05890 [Pseudorhodoferax sp.]
MDERDKTGVGVGAAVGGVTGGVAGAAAAGAAIGGVTGPVGAAAGAVAGAVVGALAGKGLATTADLAEEEKYWRSNHGSRPYASGASYDDYGPAYLYGADAYGRYPGRSFDEAEPELRDGWAASRGASTLEWSHARHASRDAWQRVGDAAERAIPGDADRDGR